jgi:DNA-binding SARP family transcriptional activator
MSLEITLTGQLAAEADGNRADAKDLPGRQAPLVFAYLVAERDRPVPSEELAEAVWGGALPPTWRPALRGVVSKVRGFLDLLGLPAADTLTSSAGCYRLVLPSDTAVDVELAEGESDAAKLALGAGQLAGALAAAERASTIAGRPLLPGHDGAWVEDRRAALHQVRVRSLELLVDVHLAAGRGGQAVGPAAELVSLEPFRDSAHRRLLRAHTAAGDRGEALRAYDRYRRVLAEELGVGPSPELEAAYLELLHAEPAGDAPARSGTAGPPTPPTPPAPAPAGGVFVGRASELGRLGAAWADARAGRRRTVLVAGEAGIGKTRLVTELAGSAEGDGAVVLAGRCDPQLGVPYLPLREAVGRHLAGYPSERLRALLGPRAAELVRFWPELAWRLPALPPPSTAGHGADPYLLFEALTGLLETVAVTGPVLLLVDDLHGADEASLLLLRSLANARRPARLLTVLTYRDGERASRASLTAALGDLVRAPGAELLTLDGLDADEVAAMAGATAARPLGPGGAVLADVLQERTGGNPFLVAELLRHLVERGGLAGGDVTEVAAGPAADDVPESVRWAVGQRLARLGGPVEHVLELAAVIGYRVEVALLERVAELGYDSLLSALDTAVAVRLLEELPDGPGRYGFHHPIVRDLLYRRLAAGERARAHRRVGEALEGLTGGTSRLGELADHFALAGPPCADRAVAYARKAGAAVLADQEVAWNGALRPDGPVAALAASAELDRLTAELGDEALAYQASRARAGVLLAAGDLDGVGRLSEREARLGRERRLPHHRWLSLCLGASLALLRGDFRDSERLATEALGAGRRPADGAASMAHGAHLVFLRWLQGRPDEVEALLERLIAQQAWGAHAWPRLLPLAYAGQARHADARRELDTATAALAAGQPSIAGLVAMVGACAQLGDGRRAGQLSELLGPWAGHHLAAGHLYLGAADHHLGILAATAGRWPASLDHFRVAVAAHERLGARPWQALTAQAYAGMLRGRDDPGDRARAAALDEAAAAAAGRLGMELPGWGRPVLGPHA